MRENVLETKKLLGYRLLSEEELLRAVVTSVKVGGKAGVKPGRKPV